MSVANQTDTSRPGHGKAEERDYHGSEAPAASSASTLTRDFLRWVASAPRTYADAMEVWRTSCPRYSIWEDALADDLIRLEREAGGRMGQERVTLSPRGQARLREHRTHQGSRPEDVRRAAELSADHLAPLTDRDWRVRAGDLEWNACQTLDHVVDALGFYALTLANPAQDRLPFETASIVYRGEEQTAAPSRLLAGMQAVAAVLADVIGAASPTVRARHPGGMVEPAGFAALAVAEILVHTHDIAQGLQTPFRAPEDLCEPVIHRLCEQPPVSADAWSSLLWSTGRIALPEHARLVHWSYRYAPPDTWDGAIR